MFKQSVIALTSAAAMGIGFTVNAEAASLVIPSSDNGWYTGFSYSHFPEITNVVTGSLGDFEDRSFGVFDLSSITGNIVQASLRVLPGNGDFESNDVSEIFEVWDVTTDVTSLVVGGIGLVDTFDDLGTGKRYGSEEVFKTGSFSEPMPEIIVDLSGALEDLNKARGSLFATGHVCPTCAIGEFEVFNSVSDGVPAYELVLEIEETESVPEPISILGLLAISTVAAMASRRKAIV